MHTVKNASRRHVVIPGLFDLEPGAVRRVKVLQGEMLEAERNGFVVIERENPTPSLFKPTKGVNFRRAGVLAARDEFEKAKETAKQGAQAGKTRRANKQAGKQKKNASGSKTRKKRTTRKAKK